MDYSYYELEKKEEALSSHTEAKRRRVGVLLIRILFVTLIAILVVGISGTFGIVRGIIANVPDAADFTITPSGYATFIYYPDGVTKMQKLTTSDSNRIAVKLSDVPVALQHAVVAIEDERFYQHNGIDPKGILRALVVGVRSRFRRTEGASTITQQLLKNNVFTTWTEEKTLIDRIKRKVQEQFLAVRLEQQVGDKDLILEAYLNTINLGAGTYGVEAAAQKYFGKSVKELNLSECTVLAGITQNPSKYNPIRHPEENAERRERTLRKMVEQEYISQEDMERALADTDHVYQEIQDAQQVQAQTDDVYSFFVDELTKQVVQDLMAQKGYTESHAYQLLYSGGLKVITTQDPAVQKICDEEYARSENFPQDSSLMMEWALTVRHEDGKTENFSREMMRTWFRSNVDPEFDYTFATEEEGRAAVDRYKSAIMSDTDTIEGENISFAPAAQSSLVVMDQNTGHVLAIIGGRGEKKASLTLNRATATKRQPGSTFKILSTYAPAFDIEDSGKTLATYETDEVFYYGEEEEGEEEELLPGEEEEERIEVHNADGQHRGQITLREAIIHSVNVVAVKTLTAIGVKQGFDKVRRFGITTLDPAKDMYQPLALGGISRGVTNLELTGAYAAIANKGVYQKPVFYTQVLDRDGKIVLDNREPEHYRVIKESTAWLLTSAMEDVVRQGTGRDCALDPALSETVDLSAMPVAGKTGTTSDYRDLWFVGYSPYYTIGIWSGYDDNRVIPETDTYRSYHKFLWSRIMSRLVSDKELPVGRDGQPITDVFEMPSSVVWMDVCGVSGMALSSDCYLHSSDFVADTNYAGTVCTVCGAGRPYEEQQYYYYEEEYVEYEEEEEEEEEPEPGPDLPVFDDPTPTPEPPPDQHDPTPEPQPEPQPEPEDPGGGEEPPPEDTGGGEEEYQGDYQEAEIYFDELE